MKKSILIIATLALSFMNVNATNEKTTSNAPYTNMAITPLTENYIAQVFDWKVETNKGIYSGTSLSLESAKKMITLSSTGEVVLGSEISSYFVLKQDLETNAKRNYFWEVKTTTGHARGYASSKSYAHKMIALVATGDAIVDKIIISQPQQ